MYREKSSDLAKEDFAQAIALISGDDARKFTDVSHEKRGTIHEECICSCESNCVGDARKQITLSYSDKSSPTFTILCSTS